MHNTDFHPWNEEKVMSEEVLKEQTGHQGACETEYTGFLNMFFPHLTTNGMLGHFFCHWKLLKVYWMVLEYLRRNCNKLHVIMEKMPLSNYCHSVIKYLLKQLCEYFKIYFSLTDKLVWPDYSSGNSKIVHSLRHLLSWDFLWWKMVLILKFIVWSLVA